MKKILLTACALTAFSSVNTSAIIKEGFNVSVMPGLAVNSIAFRGEIREGVSDNKLRNRSGFNLAAALGYTWSLKHTYFLGARLLGGYNFSNVRMARDVPSSSVFTYKPRLNYGFGLLFGKGFSKKIEGYFGVHLTRDQSRFKIDSTNPILRINDNLTVYSVTPVAGLSGMLRQNLSWITEVGYKIGFRTRGLNGYTALRRRNGADNPNALKFVKKPRAFIVSAGMTYHF